MPPTVRPSREMADLGDDAALPKIGQQQPDTAEVEVAPEDRADPLGLFLFDDELLVPADVAERHHAADPQPPALGGADLVADALAGDLALELGKGQQHVEGQPAHGGRGIELLGHRHERDAMGVEQLDQLGEVGQGTGQPVDLVDDDDIDPAVPDVRQQSLQRGALGRAAGIAAVVVAGADQGPAVMGLAADIGFCRLMLGIEGVELLVEPVLGRDPGIDRAADPLGGLAVMPVSPPRLRRPKKRGPDQRVPVMAKAISVRLR